MKKYIAFLLPLKVLGSHEFTEDLLLSNISLNDRSQELLESQDPFERALCYEKGKGVPQNKIEAVRWYRVAADQGHVIAQYNLAICYEKGRGIPQNKTEALRWF